MNIKSKVMRELSVEEKAKAYDKVREKIDIRFGSNVAEEIFSQFEESEDEKIRKALIQLVKKAGEGYENVIDGVSIENAIAWLEKQGEHEYVIAPKFSIGDTIRNKITNEVFTITDRCLLLRYYHDNNHLHEVKFSEQDDWELVEQKPVEWFEPKFHEGDWVTENNGETVFHITIDKNMYQLETIEGTSCHFSYEFIEKRFRLWTIQDAKDGDVLVMQKTRGTYESIFIFNKIENNRIIQYLHYFITDTDEEVCEARSIDGFLGFVGTNVHPATKEQRDLLFAKMKEAGYEWDAEKKELKMVEKSPAWSEEDEEIVEALNDYVKNLDIFFSEIKIGDKNTLSKEFREKVQLWLKSLKDRVQPQPKQEWSEEDMSKVQRICKYLDEAKKYYADITEVRECVNWLKSIKDRVQPKQEWSKEDEGILLESISVLQNNSHWILADKLKSLKDKVQPQNTWKPSEEQMDALRYVFNHYVPNATDTTLAWDALQTIELMLDQLKKLKKE